MLLLQLWCRDVTVVLVLVLLFLDLVISYRNDFLHEDDEDDFNDNVSTNEERWAGQMAIDPKTSWAQFQQHSELNTRRPRRKKKRRNRPMLYGLRGPPGPRGPAGPRGQPGAVMTKEDMLKEFKSLIKEMAERRAEELLLDRCEACTSLLNGSYSLPPEVDQMLLVPQVTAAFHMRLRRNVNVTPKTFIELNNFFQPFGGGAFERGQVFRPREGRFSAPRAGLYQFTAHLHLKLRHTATRGRTRKRLRKHDYVRVRVCINSLCEKNMSLDYISGLESNSRIFTVSVQGLLEMQPQQYASVYVDNASRVLVKVMNGSDFTGILFGV